MLLKRAIGKLIKYAFQIQGYGPAMDMQQQFLDDKYSAQQHNIQKMQTNEIPNMGILNPGVPIEKPPAPPKAIYQQFKPQSSNSTRSTPTTPPVSK